jgi:hypothetical protein
MSVANVGKAAIQKSDNRFFGKTRPQHKRVFKTFIKQDSGYLKLQGQTF